MNESKENLKALEVDVSQWRQDVQTFVDMTLDELSAINNQLASGFSGSPIREDGGPSQLADATSVDPRRSSRPNMDDATSVQQTKTDKRLAQLKQKLAAKLPDSTDSKRKGAGR